MADVESLSTYERWDGVAPGDHQFSTLDNFDYDPNNHGHDYFRRVVDKLVQEWEGNQFVGVLLHGEPGTGKSHAAVGLARAMHDGGAEVFYRFVPELSVHQTGVDQWTAARLWENTYLGNSGVQTSETTNEKRGETDITITHMSIERDDTKVAKRDPASVFPSYYAEGLERNPKIVLVMDDYRPMWRPNLRSAIEAASNFGGLIIVTSNFGDILQLDAPGERDIREIRINYDDPDSVKAEKAAAMQAEAEKLKTAFASRLMAGFVSVEFTGADHRKTNSFWTDLLDPRDFS